MKHVISDFSNGLTDQSTGDQPVAIEHLNFNVKEDGSVVVRDGSDLALAQIPAGNQRISWMGKFEDYIFAVTNKDLYVWKPLAGGVAAAWVKIFPYGMTNATAIFAYGDVNSVVTAAVVGRDMVLCLTPAATNVAAGEANIPMRVIWNDDDTTYTGGWWTATPLGLPPLSCSYETANNRDAYPARQEKTDGYAYVDWLFNFGACFYYTLNSRGRLRYFYGPLYSWQDVVFALAGEWTGDPWSCYVSYLMDIAPVHDYYRRIVLTSDSAWFCGFKPWANASGDRYPASLMQVAVWRSKANSSQLYWVDDLENTSAALETIVISGSVPNITLFTDALLGGTAVLESTYGFPACTPAPFVDGQVDMEGAPPMEAIGENNGFLFGIGSHEVTWTTMVQAGTYFGGWTRAYSTRPERVRQSVPGLVDIWPRSFYVDLDAEALAVGGINGFGVAHTLNRTYRLDGAYDQFGSGGLRKKLLSDGVGCQNPGSLARYNQIIYWLADDGFYGTDGVRVFKVSKNMRTTFSGRTCKSCTSDPVSGRIFWVLSNGTYICFPEFGQDEENRCFLKWDGSGFLNACVLADGGNLYRGRTDGYVVLHSPTATGDGDVAFEANWRSPFIGFGDPVAAKSQPRVDVLAGNRGNPYTIHLQSYRDSVVGDVASIPQYIAVDGTLTSSEGPFVLTRGVVPFKRYLKSSDLRCHTRSIRASVRGPLLGSTSGTLTRIADLVGVVRFTWAPAKPAAVIAGSLLYLNGGLVPVEVISVSGDILSVGGASGIAVGSAASSWAVYGPIPAETSLYGIVLHASGGNDDLQGGES